MTVRSSSPTGCAGRPARVAASGSSWPCSSDGVAFETIDVIEKDALGAESLERPWLMRLPGGGWRLYGSGATPGTLHWWVDAIDAPDPGSFSSWGDRRSTLPGDATTAMKDPVIVREGDDWHLWVCCHPLPDPAEADRMVTRYATSRDGIAWDDRGVALEGRPGTWDQRGARVTSVLRRGDGWVSYYDGRASAAENFEERTGVAVGDATGLLRAEAGAAGGSASTSGPDGAGGPVGAGPDGTGALRYGSAVPVDDGRLRLYYEARRADGAHALVTELVTAPADSARAEPG